MGFGLTVLMRFSPKSQRPNQPAHRSGNQARERAMQDIDDRRAHASYLFGTDIERRRDLQDVWLVLAEADEDRKLSMAEHAVEVEGIEFLAKPTLRPARRVEFDADEQAVNAHLAHVAARRQSIFQQGRKQVAR